MPSASEILSSFHPTIAEWFTSEIGEPTPAQVRGWKAIRARHDTLIAAPTGSGKTLAAFLSSLDELLTEGLASPLPDEVRVVYVSPLKALSADIHKNLAEPRRQIRARLEAQGLPPVRITAAVRTGDTPSSARAAMLRTPPHILVTTPESLFLLLTAERSRAVLRTVNTIIVDEIHAMIDDRRGSHLALSLERLQHVAERPLRRIGLSATQNPIRDVAQFLVGSGRTGGGQPACTIVDEGHRRELDLQVEVPDSPLDAVMAGEVWDEIYERLVALIETHRTTLVFVNTRRLAERIAHRLTERLGQDAVTAHHGSLSKDVRLDAEERLKSGKLRALVATASLELGIDIGYVDLVCQLGSTRWISTFLQRVGRSGHSVHGTPKGRLFPLTRDDLVECLALLRAVRRGELDRIIIPDLPRDVLAQQIVAEAACEDWAEDDLYALIRRAYPYRDLSRAEFHDVVAMLAQGFATRRGRRGALVHYDGVNRRVRGRRGARLAALTSGGAIPDVADYRVIQEPTETFVGTLNEDFAIESSVGDIFQLGNTSWQILKVETGRVRVADAKGQPPTIPFWLGEAPGRSRELSRAVSDLRQDIEQRLPDPAGAVAWLAAEVAAPRAAALQAVAYLAETKRLLGVVPTQSRLVLERFFDESGGMQLVMHAPYGSRINRAWGLSLRKRFCRTFNFELQAAATEEGLVLSLGAQHSFPLDDVFHYLHTETVRDLLVQALLDAPMFGSRWRWNVTRSLAVLRQRGGRRVPPQLQRMQAEDLLAACFPDATACLENIAGDREIPEHPLVRQTIDDCLREAMDIDAFTDLLTQIEAGALTLVARDTPEPSPLAAEILNAAPYAFLDDAPLEERRTQAVQVRRAFEPSSAADLGALDPAAIARVREEAWPHVESADELHDTLMTAGFLTQPEIDAGRADTSWRPYLEVLQADQRVVHVAPEAAVGLWVAVERAGEITVALPGAARTPEIPADPAADQPTAVRELLRGRLEITGPVTGRELAAALGVEPAAADAALMALEHQGSVLRGHFSPQVQELEWCDRRLLARIHRYTLHKLRAEIEPVTAADFMRFLFVWQHVHPEHRLAGPHGLDALIEQLDGFEVAAQAWEADVLPTRVDGYDPVWLDGLCLGGRAAWGRLSPRAGPSRPGFRSGPVRSTPVAIFLREHAAGWMTLRAGGPAVPPADLSSQGRAVLAVLEERGASFFAELSAAAGLLRTHTEQALGELVAQGLVTADSFAGLRALLVPADRRRRPPGSGRHRHRPAPFGVENAGRWSELHAPESPTADGSPRTERTRRAEAVEALARALLLRYGVVFRRVLERESNLPPWRELLFVLRRLEARGDIRGGRFVAGFAGEQFALPEAIGQMRRIRKTRGEDPLIGISAADPLNLTGIITPGDRIPALAANRVVFRQGVPIAAKEAGRVQSLTSDTLERDVERALVRRPIPPTLRRYLGKTG